LTQTASPSLTPPIEFGTDGIRGVAGAFPLEAASVLRIGRAIGRWLVGRGALTALVAPRVVIGTDTRKSADWLLHTLAGALMSELVEVESVGVTSTPGIAYQTRAGGFSLGLMISASHNPASQNGIKLFGPDGFKLHDDDETAIEVLIAADDAPASPRPLFGQFTTSASHHHDYLAHLTADLAPDALRGLRLVLDCANGSAYQLAPAAFRARGADVTTLNVAPDGLNINAAAGSEHVRRDRSALLAAVKLHNAAFGIAFDGDADRLVFVTPEGMLVDGDHLLGILALEMKAQGRLPGNAVVATDMSNSGLEHYLTAQGIALSRTKVGDRYVMERMREGGFALGGEQAGHIILLDADHTCGDGIYAALQVTALAAAKHRATGETLTDLASRIPRYPQVIASAHLSGRVDLKSVPGLTALQEQTLAAFGGKGRVNMRFSGTEPNLLRVMIEGGPDTSMPTVVARAMALCEPVIRATNSVDPVVDIVDCVTGAPVSV
jgi:phosphoglucosamine mutase